MHPNEARVLSGMWRRRTVALETAKQHSCFAPVVFLFWDPWPDPRGGGVLWDR